jgi:hypothetical protein
VELYWPPLAAAARLLVDAAPHPTSLAMFFFLHQSKATSMSLDLFSQIKLLAIAVLFLRLFLHRALGAAAAGCAEDGGEEEH